MFARYLTAISSGTIMTLGLIYVMQFLIGLEYGDRPEPRPRMEVSFVEVRKEEPLRPREFTPPPVHKLTETELPPQQPRSEYTYSRVGVTTAPTPPPVDGLNGFLPNSDGPLVAIVRVQPTYPINQQVKGIEGFVVVEFDVLANGSVSNVRVVETSSQGFNRAAIKAAARFKFRARVVDGVPQVTTGVRNKFTFTMENST